MGSMTVNPVTPTKAGATITKTDSGGSTATIVVAATTAQSSLDLSKLSIVIENYSSTASCVCTVGVGDNYSGISQGALAAITVGTAKTVIIGGKDFESARFLKSTDYLGLTLTTAGTVYVYATMPGQNAWNPA